MHEHFVTIKPGRMQFSSGGCREVSSGADADVTRVAPLIGSTQTGLDAAIFIWFGTTPKKVTN